MQANASQKSNCRKGESQIIVSNWRSAKLGGTTHDSSEFSSSSNEQFALWLFCKCTGTCIINSAVLRCSLLSSRHSGGGKVERLTVELIELKLPLPL